MNARSPLPPPGADGAALLAGLPHAAWLVDLATRRIAAANVAAGSLFGRHADSLIGLPADELAASPEDLAWWDAAADGNVAPLLSDTVLAAAGGQVLHVSRSIGLVPGGEAGMALVVVFDRSAERRADADREVLLGDLQATLEATADGIVVTDPSGCIRSCNRRFAELWELPVELLQTQDDEAIQSAMARAVRDGAVYAAQLQVLKLAPLAVATDRIELVNGSVLERLTRPLLRAGRVQGRVWSFRDLTERLAAEERAHAAELQDPLTGLANRRVLAQRVEAASSRVRREGGSFALMMVDLDCFRRINDSLGHEIGDRVLQDAAHRIRGCLREGDLLARLGGDQFAVLLQAADGPAAEATARRVLANVGQPCSVDGAEFSLTCSIGIAIAPAQGSRVDDLSRHAETALRAVKSAGRANYRLHQLRDDSDRRADMRLDQAMRQALVSGRFRLHYQPQIELQTGAIVGAEALLRWRDPELGEVAPGRFIPVAEDSGFIVAIGDWVLGHAVRQAALWHSRGQPLPIAVNVSALQFQQAHFVDRVASVLAASGVPPHLLELELTESILLRDADEALNRLHALQRLGVGISIDDFGTGYSSLAYLKRFPIGKLKIDRSFVMGLPHDDSDIGIVNAILQMARALGMRVIAEGVETEAQRQFLQSAGCDQFQGFLYAPALDPLSFEQRLAAPAGQAAPTPAAARVRLVHG